MVVILSVTYYNLLLSSVFLMSTEESIKIPLICDKCSLEYSYNGYPIFKTVGLTRPFYYSLGSR